MIIFLSKSHFSIMYKWNNTILVSCTNGTTHYPRKAQQICTAISTSIKTKSWHHLELVDIDTIPIRIDERERESPTMN